MSSSVEEKSTITKCTGNTVSEACSSGGGWKTESTGGGGLRDSNSSGDVKKCDVTTGWGSSTSPTKPSASRVKNLDGNSHSERNNVRSSTSGHINNSRVGRNDNLQTTLSQPASKTKDVFASSSNSVSQDVQSLASSASSKRVG